MRPRGSYPMARRSSPRRSPAARADPPILSKRALGRACATRIAKTIFHVDRLAAAGADVNAPAIGCINSRLPRGRTQLTTDLTCDNSAAFNGVGYLHSSLV